MAIFNPDEYFSRDDLIRNNCRETADKFQDKVRNPDYTSKALKERITIVSMISGMFLVLGASIMIVLMGLFGLIELPKIWVDLAFGLSFYFYVTGAIICFRGFAAMKDLSKYKKNLFNDFSPNDFSIPKTFDLIPGFVAAPMWVFVDYLFI